MSYNEAGRRGPESACNCKKSVTDVTFWVEAPTRRTLPLYCRSLADRLCHFERRQCAIALQRPADGLHRCELRLGTGRMRLDEL